MDPHTGIPGPAVGQEPELKLIKRIALAVLILNFVITVVVFVGVPYVNAVIRYAGVSSAHSEPAPVSAPTSGDVTLELCQTETPSFQLKKDCLRQYFYYRGFPLHPSLIDELVTSLADSGHQVISLNLEGSANSNRYCCDGDYTVRTTSDGKLLVQLNFFRDYPEESDETFCPRCVFQYAYEGATDDGLLVVRTWTGYGGSGIFSRLLILRMGEMNIVERKNHKRGKLEETGRELTLNTVARVLLGDREKHSINVVGTQIYVDGEGLLSGPLPLSNQEPETTAEAGTT